MTMGRKTSRKSNTRKNTRKRSLRHNKRSRRGGSWWNPTTWLSVCRTCHDWIETHPTEAIELGLSIKRK